MISTKGERPLSVCFFSHSAQLAGAERSLLELVTELTQDHGVLCTVILPGDGPLKSRFEETGATILVVPYLWWGDIAVHTADDVNARLQASFKGTLRTMLQHLGRLNPDIIFTNTIVIPWGAVTAAFLSKPHVWFVREFGIMDHGINFFQTFASVLDFIRCTSNIILTNSDAVRKTLFGDVTAQNIMTAYMHIDIPGDAISKDDSCYFSMADSVKLVISGPVNEGKGQRDAVLAVKELINRGYNVELVIMGENTSKYASLLKKMVEDGHLDEAVKFLSFMENPYVVVNQADIVLVCSRNEAFGRVALESMLLKKPVIGTDSGGTPELVSDGFSGLLYSPGNYMQLAEKIEYFIEHKEKMQEYGGNGYKLASNRFTKEAYGGKIFKLLQGLKEDTNPLASPHYDFVSKLVSGIFNELEEKTCRAAELNSTLRTRDARIEDLNVALQTRDAQVEELNAILRTRDAQVEELNAILRTRDAQVEELNAILQTRDALNRDLDSKIIAQVILIGNIQGNLDARDNDLRRSQQECAALRNSYSWRAVSKIHRIIDRFFPLGTRRRLLMKRIFLNMANPAMMFKTVKIRNLKTYFHLLKTVDPLTFENRLNAEDRNNAMGIPRKVNTNIPNPEELCSPEELTELVFKRPSDPLVTIIIPVFNQWKYTYICLKSILENTENVDYEVIVADDCSHDQTGNMLKKVINARVITNKRNTGFIRNCNNAAMQASGKYLLLLNNDTYVTRGWLKALTTLPECDEKVGIVGAKLLYGDGKLQEAGCIIWNNEDGLVTNYGRSQDPDNYEYNYPREVDYCSGCCLLVRKDLFNQVKGFDSRYIPAYCEDADLAFKARDLGYKVIYQPEAEIIHYEGVTHGWDWQSPARTKMVENKKVFFNRWKDKIQQENFPAVKDAFLARDRSRNKRHVLFIEYKVPTWDQDAGSVTIYNYLQLLAGLGFKTTFVPYNGLRLMPYTLALQRLGIEVIYGEFDFDKWIEVNGKYIDVAWLARPEISSFYIDKVRKYSMATVLYYVHDLHYLREQRRYLIEKNPDILKESERFREMEFSIFKKADVIMTPSSIEAQILSEEIPGKRIEVIPAYIYEEQLALERIFSFDERRDLVYLGGFTHLPNIDAVLWFTGEVLPGILQKLPDVKFIILGSNPPEHIQALASSNITVTGYVDDLTPYFQKAKVSVVPLRYGAGLKGKIVVSMSYAVPIVTTGVGNEGLGLIDGEEALIADDPLTFAQKVVELYTDKVLWEKISRNSLNVVRNRFSAQVARKKFLDIINFETKG